MPSVETVNGPIDVEELGKTLIHEHFRTTDEAMRAQFPHLYDEEAEWAAAMADAHALECARESADPLGQRGVGLHAVGSDERRTVRCAPRAAFDPRSNAEISRAARLHGGTINRVESENADNPILPARSSP